MKEFNTKAVMAAYHNLHKAMERLSRFDRYPNSYEDRKDLLARVNEAKEAWSAEAGKLNAIIEAAEGRAKERKIDAMMICRALEIVEDKLGSPKKAMPGIKASVDMNSQDFPNAYKYRAQSTLFNAEYRNGAWRITDIRRDDCRKEKARFILTLTDEAKDAIIEKHTTFID